MAFLSVFTIFDLRPKQASVGAKGKNKYIYLALLSVFIIFAAKSETKCYKEK